MSSSKEKRRKAETTVLYREGRNWDQREVGMLMNKLNVPATIDPHRPEYLMLFGHYTEEEVNAVGADLAYTALQITKGESEDFPPTQLS